MAKVVYEDLSGTSTPVTGNPYEGLINACHGDPKLIQERYSAHRLSRNAQQKEKILSEDFQGWILDEYLVKLDGPRKDETFLDPRYCLVFWGRPPLKVRNLVDVVQSKLKDAAPDLWLMPIDNLHITVMEVAHSKSKDEIAILTDLLQPHCKKIADYTQAHRARLIKPLLSYDSAALALSFVPAAGESVSHGRNAEDDKYTYHHLRRDSHTTLTESGVPVGSRYVVPSAHVTIARFNTPNVFGGDPYDGSITQDIKNRRHWINEIEMINKWLEAEFWPQEEGNLIKPGGEWLVGEEKGLDFRHGKLWYGGGETIYLGEGFLHGED
ncbi:RNA ligase/cyclic nucleotide phosphodiesterase [Exophiala viscosa]|uniref:RNA ligase/cyclic nucleotide phosphodiesterase n=1 Tax=Exophiala viscosa TaxID=2486360 RepID=A0AAN6DSP6_9EURO|nr:RNA ligase/cyclic nucleotide phosphodiesterase [Exophiala viscosa]